MDRIPGITASKPKLWLGAFDGFYRPSVEEVRRLDPVSKFLSRSVILAISAQAAVIAGLLAAAERRFHTRILVAGFAILAVIAPASPRFSSSSAPSVSECGRTSTAPWQNMFDVGQSASPVNG